jgi:hypothetical protein
MTLFQDRVRDLADEAEDFLPARRTDVPCDYVFHPNSDLSELPHAVITVGVDTEQCCNIEELSRVNMCWQCTTSREGPMRDKFQCRCGQDNSVHESKNLRFLGVLQPTRAPASA